MTAVAAVGPKELRPRCAEHSRGAWPLQHHSGTSGERPWAHGSLRLAHARGPSMWHQTPRPPGYQSSRVGRLSGLLPTSQYLIERQPSSQLLQHAASLVALAVSAVEAPPHQRPARQGFVAHGRQRDQSDEAAAARGPWPPRRRAARAPRCAPVAQAARVSDLEYWAAWIPQ